MEHQGKECGKLKKVVLRHTQDLEETNPNGESEEVVMRPVRKEGNQNRTETTRETTNFSNETPITYRKRLEEGTSLNKTSRTWEENIFSTLHKQKYIPTESEEEADRKFEREQPSLSEIVDMETEAARRRAQRRRRRKAEGAVLSDTGSEEMDRDSYGKQDDMDEISSESEQFSLDEVEQKEGKKVSKEVHGMGDIRNPIRNKKRKQVDNNTEQKTEKKARYTYEEFKRLYVNPSGEKYDQVITNLQNNREWGSVNARKMHDEPSRKCFNDRKQYDCGNRGYGGMRMRNNFPNRMTGVQEKTLNEGVRRKMENIMEMDRRREEDERQSTAPDFMRKQIFTQQEYEDERDIQHEEEVHFEEDEIMPSQTGRVRRGRGRPKGVKNRATGGKETKLDSSRSGSQYTADEALKLAMAWSKQTEQRIQSGEWLWTKIHEICTKVYNMNRTKASLRCKWPTLTSDCHLWNSLYDRVVKELGTGNFSEEICRRNTQVLFHARRSRGKENPNGNACTMKYVEAAEYLRSQPKFGLIDENGSIPVNKRNITAPPLVSMMSAAGSDRMKSNDMEEGGDIITATYRRQNSAWRDRPYGTAGTSYGEDVENVGNMDIGRGNDQRRSKERKLSQCEVPACSGMTDVASAVYGRNFRTDRNNGDSTRKDDSASEVVNLVDADEITPNREKQAERYDNLRSAEYSKIRLRRTFDVYQPTSGDGSNTPNRSRELSEDQNFSSTRSRRNELIDSKSLPIRPLGVVSRALNHVPRGVRDFDAICNSDSDEFESRSGNRTNLVRGQGIKATKEREAKKKEQRYDRLQLNNVREEVRRSNDIMRDMNQTQQKQMKVEMIYMALQHTEPESNEHKRLMGQLLRFIDEDQQA